jgi:hypothetical protein
MFYEYSWEPSIATGYRLDDGGTGVRFPMRLRIFFISRLVWSPSRLLSKGLSLSLSLSFI